MKKLILMLCPLFFVFACGKSQEGIDIPTANLSTIQLQAVAAATSKSVRMPLNPGINSQTHGTCTVQRQADGSVVWSISATGLPPGTTAMLFVDTADDNYEALVSKVVNARGSAKSGRQPYSPAPPSGALMTCQITDQAQLMAFTASFPAP